MKDIVNHAKGAGFVFPGSDIYGGLANAWDYGPYGSLLKENIKNLWIREMVQRRRDMTLLDAAILMNPEAWVASGHVASFSDPLMDCRACKARQRADKLVEAHLESVGREAAEAASMKHADLEAYITTNKIVCPDCGAHDFTPIRSFNLMFRTFQGVIEDMTSAIYLRPETAQGIFVNFANVVRTSRRKVPFGVAQVGKAFRNEITPGNFIFRTREFEQMEIEYFCEPESQAPGRHLEYHAEWKNICMKFLTDTVGLIPEHLRFRDHDQTELSHYSAATTDIEYRFPFSWGELWGIADRTDFDLKAHMQRSGQDLSYLDPATNAKYIPYVIEPSVGLTRLFLATFIDAYHHETDEHGEDRIIMKFKPAVAPVKAVILPLVKKFVPEAEKVYAELSKHFVCEYAESGSIGKRYYRYDAVGTPYAITIDGDTAEKGTVTVRDRDTGKQDLVAIVDLVAYIRERVE